MHHIESRRVLPPRLAIAALALALATAAVACSTGSGGKKVSLRSAAAQSGTSGAPGSTAAVAGVGGTGTSGLASTGATAGSTGPTTTAATAHTGATTGTTARPGPAATTATTAPRVTTPVATGPAPPTPGNYTYNVSGSSTITYNGTPSTSAALSPSILKVSPGPTPGTQVWNNSSILIADLTFNAGGIFMTSETVMYNGSGATCSFAGQGVASPPWPLAAGRSASAQADCGSGQVMAVHVVDTASSATATTTLGPLTVIETDSYAPSMRLPVRSEIWISGNYGAFSVSSHSIYTLTSARPS
jgi:hypothetical protein